MRHMISPLDLEWDELLVYQQLYLRSEFTTGITEYTDRQIEESLRKAKVGRTRIRTILKKFTNEGLLIEISKGTRGNNPKPAIGKIVKIKDVTQPLNEPNATLKQPLEYIENSEVEGCFKPNATLKQPLNNPLNKETKNKEIYSEIIERFNSTCSGLSKVMKVTDKRKKSIDARLKEYDKETIYKVFDMVSSNKFLNGDNNRGWKADFDWLINPNKFVKVLEGNYSNQEQQIIEKPKEEYKAFDTSLRL